MTPILRTFLVLCTLSLIAGCSSTPAPQAFSEANPETDFQAFETFALLPLPDELPGADPGALRKYGQTAQDGMSEALVAKGYKEVPAEDADFVLSMKGAVIPTINVQSHGFNYGFYNQSSFWGGSNYPNMTFGTTTDLDADANDFATLSVEIFEVKSKELVWVGWMSGKRSNKPVEHATVKERFASILASFPAK